MIVGDNMLFKNNLDDYKEDYKIVNHLRCLSIDMIDNAKSGHPGICLGAATILYTLISKHLEFNRKELDWIRKHQDQIIAKANRLYLLITQKKALKKLADRCLNFKKLESVLEKWNNKN